MRATKYSVAKFQQPNVALLSVKKSDFYIKRFFLLRGFFKLLIDSDKVEIILQNLIELIYAILELIANLF